MNKKLMMLLVVISIFLVGCSGNDSDAEAAVLNNDNDINPESQDEAIEVIEEEAPVTIIEEEEEEVIEKEISLDYDKIRPNEAGRVMVIMYHSLGEKESNYVSTPDILRQNLKDLYDKDYVLVSLEDFVKNEMDIPAGKTPVVLTFDDGHISNFKVVEKDGELLIDPDSAVGIINTFYEEHPDFNRKASFALNANISFSQNEYKAYKLNYLIDQGYDISSHSYGHEDLTELDGKGIQKTLGKNVNSIESILKDYSVNTLALPFGKRSKEPFLEKFIYKGVYEEKPYEFIAVLNVGWNPTYAPIHNKFNYKSINRVQSGSGDFQLSYWIDYFDNAPDQKYISDGIKEQITVPEEMREEINESTLADKALIFYERTAQ